MGGSKCGATAANIIMYMVRAAWWAWLAADAFAYAWLAAWCNGYMCMSVCMAVCEARKSSAALHIGHMHTPHC